jgi:hypothetical protein
MLTNYLRAQQKLGNIQWGEPGCSNPEQAVEVFIGLLVSGATLRAWLGLKPTFVRTPAQRKAWVSSAVDMFLAAMQPRPSAD